MNEQYGLTVENLLNVLPDELRQDEKMLALATGVAEILTARPTEIEQNMLYQHIDTLPEDLLDQLAHDFGVSWWDNDWDIEQKRATFRESWHVRRHLGTKYAVGVSGGKDSLTLLVLLAALREYYPVKFDLAAMSIDMGLGGMDFSPVAELCAKLGVPYTVKKTEIGPIIFDYRKEKNPCSMCAKMRRGALHDLLREQGYNKIALGHHYDDAVETFLMSLLYEGRISCFEPVTYLSRTGITQIRPMLYVGEQAVTRFAAREQLPVVHNTCPADKHTKRQEVKELIAALQAQYPDLKTKVFGAMQRLPLPQWGILGGKKQE